MNVVFALLYGALLFVGIFFMDTDIAIVASVLLGLIVIVASIKMVRQLGGVS